MCPLSVSPDPKLLTEDKRFHLIVEFHVHLVRHSYLLPWCVETEGNGRDSARCFTAPLMPVTSDDRPIKATQSGVLNDGAD